MKEHLAALRHRDEAKRRAAALALGRLGSSAEEAVAPLIAALVDPMPAMRQASREALARIDPNWSRNPRALQAVPALIDGLGSRSQEIVLAASGELQSLGTMATPALLELLADDSKDLRQVAAARTLGRIKDTAAQVIERLTRLLKNDKTHVRLAAAEALTAMGSCAESGVAELTEALADWNAGVRQAAARCLGQIGLPAADAVPALCRLLSDEEDTVRQAAIGGLGGIGLVAVPLLVEMLERRDIRELEEWLRWQAETRDWLRDSSATQSANWDPASADRNVTWRFQQSLAELEQRTRRLHQSVATVLGQMGAGAAPAVPSLVRVLDDADLGLRLAAIWSLGQIGPASLPALKGLIQKLSDSRESHRKAASESLSRIDPAWAGSADARRAVPGLLEELRSPGTATGQAAFEVLVLLGTSAVPVLAETLTNPDRVLREAAARALGTIGPAAQPAIPALTTALADEHGWVREAAAEALKKIQQQ